MNREHAILEADRCVAVSPSDTAPALIALDAEMVIRNSGGERVVSARDYFIGPWLDITRMTRLEPGDLLVSIRIPATFAGKPHFFEKVRDRQVWDFPLVNIASTLSLNGNSIADSRLVVGGVAARPMRLERRRRRDSRSRAQRRDRKHGRRDGDARRGHPAPQRLQGSAHAEPREARDSGGH